MEVDTNEIDRKTSIVHMTIDQNKRSPKIDTLTCTTPLEIFAVSCTLDEVYYTIFENSDSPPDKLPSEICECLSKYLSKTTYVKFDEYVKNSILPSCVLEYQTRKLTQTLTEVYVEEEKDLYNVKQKEHFFANLLTSFKPLKRVHQDDEPLKRVHKKKTAHEHAMDQYKTYLFAGYKICTYPEFDITLFAGYKLYTYLFFIDVILVRKLYCKTLYELVYGMIETKQLTRNHPIVKLIDDDMFPIIEDPNDDLYIHLFQVKHGVSFENLTKVVVGLCQNVIQTSLTDVADPTLIQDYQVPLMSLDAMIASARKAPVAM